MQLQTEKDQKEIKKHGNYEFPVHISLEKIQAYEQDSFPWHWHPEIELTWIMSGQIEYLVNWPASTDLSQLSDLTARLRNAGTPDTH